MLSNKTSVSLFCLLFLAFIGASNASAHVDPESVCWVKGLCNGNVTHTEEKIRYLGQPCVGMCVHIQSPI